MLANIHDALAQVRTLKSIVMERGFFRGYSGNARITSGSVAMMGSIILSMPSVPDDPQTHLLGWGLVLGIAVLANYGALAYWFVSDPEVKRDPIHLAPAMDAIPALCVGAGLSAVLVRSGQYDALFGTWMALYGLAQVAYRRTLPGRIHKIGLAYVACGMAYLVVPGMRFTNPWPMGIVFFTGEWAGGAVLLKAAADRLKKEQRSSS